MSVLRRQWSRKVSSSTSFSFENVIPTVNLSGRKLKSVVKDSEKREKEIMSLPPGWMLPKYVQQNKITYNSDAVDSIRSMTAIALLSKIKLFWRSKFFLILDSDILGNIPSWSYSHER